MDLIKIQKVLRDFEVDGWLFYDFHNRDPISYRILGLDFGKFTSRRWFYFIPSDGEPVGLAHKVEPTKLDSLPGKKTHYLSWEELHTSLQTIIGKDSRKIAMQYSPMNHIPYVSMADAGTVELIKSFGIEVVSSADLVQIFEAVIDEKGYRSHIEASKLIYRIKNDAFKRIEDAIKDGIDVSEYEIQQYILKRFDEENLTCMDEYPIVGVNDHPANPHFEPTKENSVVIKRGDTILIDLWARFKETGSVFSDITWCGFAGKNPPEKYVEIFHIARDARKAGLQLIHKKFKKNENCYGWEVDNAVRKIIKDAGYGEHFIHRTGHSIGEEVHGNGVNIDNLETKEQRQLIPGICFSIEPGIYLDNEMAVRTEINVFITLEREVIVAGEEQEDLVLLDVD
jgi:Xaa-Pro aminopeptidase